MRAGLNKKRSPSVVLAIFVKRRNARFETVRGGSWATSRGAFLLARQKIKSDFGLSFWLVLGSG